MKIPGRLVHSVYMILPVFLGLMLLAGPGRSQTLDMGQGPFSVVILENQTREDAERGKQLLEGWGYSPVTIDQQGERFKVLYGEFDSSTAARAVLETLRDEGISAKGVVQAPSGAPEPPPIAVGAYAVVVQEFKTSSNAMMLQQTLSQAGYTPVSVRQSGNYYRVLITDLPREEAILTLGQLRQQGYMTARVRRMDTLTEPAPAVPAQPLAVEGPSDATAGEDYGISAAVMQTDLWNELSEDQKREVVKSMAIQEQLRKGDALAQEVIDINKRLTGLDENVRKIISQIEQEKSTAERVRGEIGELYKEADNLMRAEEYQEAIVRLNKILALDKDNQYGQAAFARRLIARAESRLRDERYEGQSADIENTYQKLKAEAERLAANKNSAVDLQAALGLWFQIKNLDLQKYGTTANGRISELTADLNNLNEQNQLALSESRRIMFYTAAGLGGAFVILLAMLVMVWLRGRARHNQLMMKVQEITSIRPMRELQGGPRGILEGLGEGESNDFDIFAPQTPRPRMAPKPKATEDSFAGLGDTKDLAPEKPTPGKAEPAEPEPKKTEPKKPAQAPSPADELFGAMGADTGEEEPTVKAMGDDMNFDHLFGGNGSETATGDEPETDPFLHIGEEAPDRNIEEKRQPLTPETKPAAAQDGVTGEETPEPAGGVVPGHAANNGEPISFDDIVSVSSAQDDAGDQSEAQTQAGDLPEDLLALFDDVVGPSPEETAPAAKGPSLDHLKDSPFSSMLEEDHPERREAPRPVVEDEVEIPLINLNDVAPVNPEVHEERTRASDDLPSFSLDDIGAFDEGPAATKESQPLAEMGGGEDGISIDFKDDAVGRAPMGWEGQYDYASLSVEDHHPPASGGKYVCFRKPEGGGKAFYCCKFPEVRGKCTIEFDLCCEEKNKFLLGFYIEKDSQFQTSIHTKILRSETQTTQTIHMQGESSPYLLGSWVHIKYVTDLDEGVINGYIDSTHVAHDLSLMQNPGSLNTFSIRDNINTTGVLMLANLRIHRGR